MQRMLLTFALMTAAAPSVAAEVERVVVEASSSNRIFIGHDRSMPTTGEYDFAITLPKGFKQAVSTSDLPKMLKLLKEVLPHWYVSAIVRSGGDNECSVVVNDISYSETVDSWVWDTWGIDEPTSLVRRHLESYGIHDEIIAKAAIGFGLCSYLKKKDLRLAVDVVASYGKSQSPTN